MNPQKPVFQFLVILSLLLVVQGKSLSQCQSTGLPAGSFLVQTGTSVAAGLKPYGMIYDLITNYQVPVYWCINPTKQKDSADFVHNGVQYRGGTFAINANYITPQITSVINSWRTNQGVVGNYSVSPFFPPVYDTITSVPKIIIDNGSGNASIIIDYYFNAGIPNTAYTIGIPSNLNGCSDLWVNPHDDPTWTKHRFLRNFTTLNKGNIWMQCHTPSVIESVRDSSNLSIGLNFLTTTGLQCYNSGKCGSIGVTHAGNWSNPVTYQFPASPMMQFIGTLDAAVGGSEKWYGPVNQWNPETIRGIRTNNGSVATSNDGAILVYGPAYSNYNNGYVMYQGGHDFDGNQSSNVAAQRAFFNFVLFTALGKQLTCSNTIPTAVYSNSTNTFTANVTNGIGPYTYLWEAPIGTFTNSTSSTTTYNAPIVQADTTIPVRLKVTDGCGRINQIIYCLVVRRTQLPVDLITFDAKPNGTLVKTDWITASEKNNDFFTVERSRDALRFEPVGNVDGAGNSSILRYYSFDDEKPHTGLSYYRLKQTDYDGSVAYSRVVPVRLRNAQINVFPNPANGTFFVDYSAFETEDFDLRLIDMSGRVVFQQHLSTEVGAERLAEIHTEQLAKGLYSVVCSTPDEIVRQHLVLQ